MSDLPATQEGDRPSDRSDTGGFPMAGPVNVRGYRRADGTFVRSHTRALPTRQIGWGIGALGIPAVIGAVLLFGSDTDAHLGAPAGGQPTPTSAVTAPAPAGPVSAATARTAGPIDAVAHDTAGLAIRPAPGFDGPVLTRIPDGQTVQVLCYARGPLAKGWGGTSPYWNKVTYAGTEGFAADVALDTRRQVYLLVPTC